MFLCDIYLKSQSYHRQFCTVVPALSCSTLFFLISIKLKSVPYLFQIYSYILAMWDQNVIIPLQLIFLKTAINTMSPSYESVFKYKQFKNMYNAYYQLKLLNEMFACLIPVHMIVYIIPVFWQYLTIASQIWAFLMFFSSPKGLVQLYIGHKSPQQCIVKHIWNQNKIRVSNKNQHFDVKN